MSQITLFKNCKIVPDKNFIVEGIDTYLAGLVSITISNFQYLRNDLQITIKINKSEEFTESIFENNYNYLKVVQNNVSYYYFISKKTQVAESTIALELTMDVLNTYPWNSAFTPSNRTKVLREHKDRYAKDFIEKEFTGTLQVGTTSTDIDAGIPPLIFNENQYKVIINDISGLYPEEVTASVFVTPYPPKRLKVRLSYPELDEDKTYNITLVTKFYKPLVDLYSEGINPKLYKKEISVLNNSVPYHWYLIYKTNQLATPENPQPVNCFLCSDREIEVKVSNTIILRDNDIESGKVYCFQEGKVLGHERYRVKAVFNGTTISTNTYYANMWAIQRYGFIIDKDPNNTGKLRLRTYIWEEVEAEGLPPVYNNYLQSTFNNISEISLESQNNVITCYKGDSTPYANGLVQNTEFAKTDNIVSLKGFNSIDRTESTLIKIFALPYLPSNYALDNDGIIIFGDEWIYDSEEDLMKLKDLNTKFESLIETDVRDPVSEVLARKFFTIDTSSNRYIKDNKLYHSDYYLPKFVYDSFSFPFAIEKIGDNEYTQTNFAFTFVMTSTIRSRFLFKFEAYNPEYAEEDYHNILNVARNNEAVIYNSEYLTYLRTGYNIDIKAKERTERNAVIGGVLSVVGGITGTALSIGSGNPALAIKGAISGGSSIASSIISTINTIAQSEENMERHLATLKAQAVSVEGSDDLDLLENYSDNKAKLVLYKVSPKIEKSLDDLFYYTGYISEEVGIPNTHTRIWFNFLSCNLEFTGISKNISESSKASLVNLYSEGVIFLHKVNNEWNFDLNKENWETLFTED